MASATGPRRRRMGRPRLTAAEKARRGTLKGPAANPLSGRGRRGIAGAMAELERLAAARRRR